MAAGQGLLIRQMTSEREKAALRPRRMACFTVPRTAMMKAAIMVFEWPGSSPCKADPFSPRSPSRK